ncbi:hypothetical protein RND71_005956 [Anisodus tanguticus]|uniref:Uncharacterized protein n=1 Tax=Anisodus tanguticus TaxID=243964 RepID=A0AAE1VVD2_9SOLA|nr:hypothetical protein RND71_005956 [Anisodus tanguticus]
MDLPIAHDHPPPMKNTNSNQLIVDVWAWKRMEWQAVLSESAKFMFVLVVLQALFNGKSATSMVIQPSRVTTVLIMHVKQVPNNKWLLILPNLPR